MEQKVAISTPLKELVAAFQIEDVERKMADQRPKVKVGVAVGALAFIYEKVRMAVDYKEDHLLRKNAIERVLKRYFAKQLGENNIAETITKELVRAKYLANESIPETKLSEVEKIVEKYALLKSRLQGKGPEIQTWLIEIAACEIENALVSAGEREALVNFMYRVLRPHIEIKELKPNEKTLDFLIYIAVHRALARSDNAIIGFNLLRSYFPEWEERGAEADPLVAAYKEIKDLLNHSLKERLLVYTRQNIAPFLILGNVIEENIESIEELLLSPSRVTEKIKKACQKLYKESGDRLHRAAVRSVVYIFITKMLVAFLVELPFEKLFFEEVNKKALAINLLSPPLLMFLVTLSIKVPDEKNTLRIIERLRVVVYPSADQKIPKFKDKKSPSKRAQAIFGLVYLLAFLVSFGLIAWALKILHFNIISAGIFFLFLSVVSFFAFRLRLTAREYVVPDQKAGLLASMFDFLSLPILKAGSWLSEGFAQINIFAFILDFIIEAPFKTVVEIAEESLAFVREKKEELV